MPGTLWDDARPVPGVEVSTHSLNFEEVLATHAKAQRTPFHPLRASRVEAPGGVWRRVVPAACIQPKPSARPSGAPANTGGGLPLAMPTRGPAVVTPCGER